jgi:UDPglucose--hexose-1-phosphate uridylyltransferase
MSDLRRDPVSGNWVVISPAQEAGVLLASFPRVETPRESCPFCPGHETMGGASILTYPGSLSDGNGNGWAVRVIPNRMPVLQPEISLEREGVGMFDRITGVGAHEIIIDSPDHSPFLHEFPAPQIRLMLAAWKERINDLRKDSRMRYISLFRNQGRRAGARITHPHSQLLATPMIPTGIRNELAGAREYYEYKERCVFCDLNDQEREEKVRIVSQNRGFLAFCPFASRHPFEVWILPRVHRHDFGQATEEQLDDLSGILKEVSTAVAVALMNPDVNVTLKNTPYPKPRRDKWTTIEEDFHWHLEVVPRITRPNGHEWATGMFVNPTLPEEGAAYLRNAIFQAGR